MALPLQV
ncbi:hypothetical protein VCNHCC008D_001293A, partial [Vibrio cholerae O1 str. NHCC-008D]